MAGSLTAAGALRAAGGAAGRTSAPASAAWTAAGRSWARAVSAVCRHSASQVLAWDWSQPRASFRFERYFYGPSAACDGDEIGHGRGPAFRRPAQVERVLVLVPGGKRRISRNSRGSAVAMSAQSP